MKTKLSITALSVMVLLAGCGQDDGSKFIGKWQSSDKAIQKRWITKEGNVFLNQFVLANEKETIPMSTQKFTMKGDRLCADLNVGACYDYQKNDDSIVDYDGKKWTRIKQ